MGVTQMSESNIFEDASRLKLRFPSKAGQITTEDLWDLSLKSLDEIAISVNDKIAATAKSSFLTPKTNPSKELTLALGILVHVITTKQVEAQASKDAAEKRAKKARLFEILAKRQDSKLESLTEEELLKEIEAL